MSRTILHIDFDSFFASVEQQFDEKLRGKPMGVTATNGRTCIIASSKEAKKLGIKTGARSWEAYKICPSLVLVPADFNKYWEISQKFLNICNDYSPFVELFSLDEVFMDVTLTQNLYGGKFALIKKIKQRIRSEIGEYITVSVGISHNKLLAKLGSGLKKPDGIFEIKKENISEVYKEAELTDVCGIGDRIAVRLNKLGIYSLLDLRATPLRFLEEEFGKVYSQILKNIAAGTDDSEVVPYYFGSETKSVGRNYCLPRNEYDQRKILQNVFELCEEVGIKLRRLSKKARTVGFYLTGEESYHGRKTLKSYIDSGAEIFEIFKIFYKEWDLAKKDRQEAMVRQISVWATNLEDCQNTPLSLFDFENKKNTIQNTVDSINERFGDHTIRSGFLLYADKLTTVPNGYMADRFERKRVSEKFQDLLQTK